MIDERINIASLNGDSKAALKRITTKALSLLTKFKSLPDDEKAQAKIAFSNFASQFTGVNLVIIGKKI